MIQQTEARLNLKTILEAGSNDAFHHRCIEQVCISAKYHELSLECAILGKTLFSALFAIMIPQYSSIKLPSSSSIVGASYYFIVSLCDFQFCEC